MSVAGRENNGVLAAFGFSRTTLALFVVLLLAVGLRLIGIHDPILDHPNWRQGDMANIARNFFTLRYNLLYPQTNYNGPPPHYVELELQIVPFLAATLYKFFGIHAIFGRLITLTFSVSTVALLFFFARWLFTSEQAGLYAALAYATFPGSIYYGRTFTPEACMAFFLTAALYASARLLLEDERLAPRSLARATGLLALAYLAKPVAVLALLPLGVLLWERRRRGIHTRLTAAAVLIGIPLFILASYDHAVAAHAQWLWASGITTLHVLPALHAALTTRYGFLLKLHQFGSITLLFARAMLGWVGFLGALLSFLLLRRIPMRSPGLLWGWLAGGIAYAYIVVTVERVDYYLMPLLPLFALSIGGTFAWLNVEVLRNARPWLSLGLRLAGAVFFAALFLVGWRAIAPYYHYSKSAYRNAIALDHALPKNALVVLGHYGPDLLYYMNRFGWEEDPYNWTPFDEESAIAKGSRYFISVENDRFERNIELCAWMQRFPRMQAATTWPVYVTDPALVKPAAKRFWRAFRRAERAGHAAAFLKATAATTPRFPCLAKHP